MREIKFRVWDGDEMDCEVGLFNGKIATWDGDVLWSWDEQPSAPPMQFTGLVDINGVEIYEGDILEATGEGGDDIARYTVEYIAPEFTRRFIDVDKRHDDWDGLVTGGLQQHDIRSRKLFVIGNVYEHPEYTSANPANEAPVPIQDGTNPRTK